MCFLCPWIVREEFLKIFSYAVVYTFQRNGLKINFELFFRGMVQNEITKFRVIFSFLWNSFERNSEHIYLQQNGSEWNYKVLSVFLFYEIVQNGIPSFFVSSEWLETNNEFKVFSIPRIRQISDRMNQNFRLFLVPQNNFFMKNDNPSPGLLITIWFSIPDHCWNQWL